MAAEHRSPRSVTSPPPLNLTTTSPPARANRKPSVSSSTSSKSDRDHASALDDVLANGSDMDSFNAAITSTSAAGDFTTPVVMSKSTEKPFVLHTETPNHKPVVQGTPKTGSPRRSSTKSTPKNTFLSSSQLSRKSQVSLHV